MSLEAKNVTFYYRGRKKKPVLKGVNLEIHPGEWVGLKAPSGRGKTTLCRLLAGYEKPKEGEVLLDGRPLGEYKGICPVQMIWQHPEQAVNPRVRMQAVLQEGDSISERLIEGLGIERDWCNRYPGELSGGELQRFCIARALGERTRFLIADEISTMLDPITQSQIWNFLLAEVKERKIGLLVVSHDEKLMEQVCDRIMRL